MKPMFLSLLAASFALTPGSHPTSVAQASDVPQQTGSQTGTRRAPRRYPMLHGIYYSRPLNYRNLFDYPWHARMVPSTVSRAYVVPESWGPPHASHLRPTEAALPTPTSRLVE